MPQLDHAASLAHLRRSPRRALTLGLVDVEDPMNVAHAFRLADGVGATVLLVGRTPTPTVDRALTRLSRHAAARVGWSATSIDGLLASSPERPESPRAIAIEVTDASIPYPELALPEGAPLLLLVGGERHGLDERVLAWAQRHTHVPMCGAGSSLNVAMALAIVASHLAFVG